jgi:hypothetical protein
MNATENTVGHPRSWDFIYGPNSFFHVFQTERSQYTSHPYLES